MAPVSVEQVQSRLLSFFDRRPEIIFAYLFGSVAKGTAGKLSDIDIAVFVDALHLPPNRGYGYQSELVVELQSILNAPVDVVILNDTPTILKFNVLQSGILIFCRLEDKRRAFHEEVVRTYLDFKPLLEIQNLYLYRQVAEGTFGGGKTG